jgi:hypothetical protein
MREGGAANNGLPLVCDVWEIRRARGYFGIGQRDERRSYRRFHQRLGQRAHSVAQHITWLRLSPQVTTTGGSDLRIALDARSPLAGYVPVMTNAFGVVHDSASVRWAAAEGVTERATLSKAGDTRRRRSTS